MRVFKPMLIATVLCLFACSKHHSTHALGYIEGRYVYLSSAVSGQLIQLNVQKGQTVSANQLAFQLDPQPEYSELQNAQAQLTVAQQDLENLKLGERATILKKLQAQVDQVQANLIYSTKTFDRYTKLRQTHVISQAQLDQARSTYEADAQKLRETQANLSEAKLGARDHLILAQEAKVNAMAADVQKFQWMVAQKTVRFSVNGFVQDTLFRQNEFVTAGKPVIEFLPPQNRILIFFVPEKYLSAMRIGKKINFTCDGCAQAISANINYISSHAEYTPPVIYSK